MELLEACPAPIIEGNDAPTMSAGIERPQTVPPAGLAPLVVDVRGLAVLLSRSETSLDRDDAAGRLPKPIRIGRAKRWLISDIELWLRHGCPSRREFEVMRKGRN
jgi:predicted DNA-binding transcriptional regulator AlpA